MKPLRFAFLLVLFVGCASSQRKIGGRYGVIVSNRIRYSDQIVRALREQLSSVDVVASPADDAYDAVIVIDSENVTPGPTPRYTTSKTFPDSVDPYSRPIGARFAALHYTIRHGGNILAEGSALTSVSYNGDGDIMASKRPDRVSGSSSGSYGVGFEVANQIVKALKKTATPPVAQTL